MSTLTLMTYNIRLGIQQGLEPLAQIITAQAPDLVALQEVGNHWKMGPPGDSTAELARLCGMPHHHHVAAIKESTHHYGHALISKHPFEVVRCIDLPRHKDEPRALLHTLVHTPVGDVHLLSTHLSWIEDRPEQGAVLRDELLSLHEAGHHVLIAGDLNEHEPEPWLEEIKALCEDADGDLERLTFPSDAPRMRIDYLFTNRGRWREARVLDEQRASDHLPLVATWSER